MPTNNWSAIIKLSNAHHKRAQWRLNANIGFYFGSLYFLTWFPVDLSRPIQYFHFNHYVISNLWRALFCYFFNCKWNLFITIRLLFDKSLFNWILTLKHRYGHKKLLNKQPGSSGIYFPLPSISMLLRIIKIFFSTV